MGMILSQRQSFLPPCRFLHPPSIFYTKAMRKRANEMTSKTWEFNIIPIEPRTIPVIEAGAIWKKAKECANDNFKRGKNLIEVLIYYKAAVKELLDKYGVPSNMAVYVATLIFWAYFS